MLSVVSNFSKLASWFSLSHSVVKKFSQSSAAAIFAAPRFGVNFTLEQNQVIFVGLQIRQLIFRAEIEIVAAIRAVAGDKSFALRVIRRNNDFRLKLFGFFGRKGNFAFQIFGNRRRCRLYLRPSFFAKNGNPQKAKKLAQKRSKIW